MGLATFSGPSLLILDEPTNHLDIDSRAALIEAINEYEGAVILVSHDKRLLEACADRLWLVANGAVTAFDGDMDDYRKLVLEKTAVDAPKDKRAEPPARAEPAKPRRDAGMLRRGIQAAEEKMRKFEDLLRRVDAALSDPEAFTRDAEKAGQLAAQRDEVERALTSAEEEWLTLSGELEALAQPSRQ
jgi:ATP-binding cassette subfamily F protein 3